MLGDSVPKVITPDEGSALVSEGSSDEGRKDGKRFDKPWCDHCKRLWHTWETCWKLHGKPLNWKKKQGGKGRAFQAGVSDQE